MEFNELPLGFGMALAQNEMAMKRFESMAEREKQAVLRRAHQVDSRDEMDQIVAGLTERPIPEEVYPVIDTDLGRDNVENDLPAADLEDL